MRALKISSRGSWISSCTLHRRKPDNRRMPDDQGYDDRGDRSERGDRGRGYPRGRGAHVSRNTSWFINREGLIDELRFDW